MYWICLQLIKYVTSTIFSSSEFTTVKHKMPAKCAIEVFSWSYGACMINQFGLVFAVYCGPMIGVDEVLIAC